MCYAESLFQYNVKTGEKKAVPAYWGIRVGIIASGN